MNNTNPNEFEINRQIVELEDEVKRIRERGKPGVLTNLLISSKQNLIISLRHSITLTRQDEKLKEGEDWRAEVTPHIKELPTIIRSWKFWNRMVWAAILAAVTSLVNAVMGRHK